MKPKGVNMILKIRSGQSTGASLARQTKLWAMTMVVWLVATTGLLFAQTEATSFSGEAILFSATDIRQPVTGPIVIGDSGQLSPVGGVRVATVSFTNLFNGLLVLSNGSATTVGGGIL